ncbi:MAG: ABC transporter ATP-binding protein [Burkholderiaceae bacterium]|nr:MAG: ABC transporter ATP-binding protein [Burkholderiaceae bacterium]
MSDIRLDHVTKRFGNVTALNDVSLSIKNGEFVVLLGPTGAGKTTMLRLVAGLEKPSEGKIYIAGRDATSEAPAMRDVSFVFQQYSLYPHLSVYDNLAFPLRAPGRNIPEDEVDRRVRKVAELVRIAHKIKNSATRLSGGEMQRVAIGRALVREPSIYLMDEPLSSLDAKLRAELRIELKHIQADLGATFLYVTHDQTEAMTMASRIGILENGNLVQIGTPQEIYEDPVNAYVAERLGTPRINMIPVGALPVNGVPDGTVTVGVRTEHVEVKAAADGPAEIVMVEHLGSENHLHVQCNGQHLVTLAPPAEHWRPGNRAQVALKRPLFFDKGGNRIATR